MKLVPGGDNHVNGIQRYELFGGIALTDHALFVCVLFVITMLQVDIQAKALAIIVKLCRILSVKLYLLIIFLTYVLL